MIGMNQKLLKDVLEFNQMMQVWEAERDKQAKRLEAEAEQERVRQDVLEFNQIMQVWEAERDKRAKTKTKEKMMKMEEVGGAIATPRQSLPVAPPRECLCRKCSLSWFRKGWECVA